MTNCTMCWAGRFSKPIVAAATCVALTAIDSCAGRDKSYQSDPPSAVLRVGVAQLSPTNPMFGLRQLAGLLSTESLARSEEDGRMRPWLAESWIPGLDGRSLTIKLRKNVRFHDGSALDADVVAAILPESLRSVMGPAYSNVDYVRTAGTDSVQLGFKEPSPFLLEALVEAPIRKLGQPSVGTGSFAVPDDATELRANPNHYLGKPNIDRITVTNYPSVRAAWAEMLRNNLDMLYEVGVDALDSLEGSSRISTFTYTRPYQYVVAMNAATPALHPAEVRRALNLAVDRLALVKHGLNGHGVVSSGPLSPRHWALPENSREFLFDPERAADLLKRSTNGAPLHFTCLVSPDSVDERIALELKRQFAGAGIDMTLEEASREQIVERAGKRQYEAAMIEVISGPTAFRPYTFWHSGGQWNWGGFGNATIDAALDRVRRSSTDEEYRAAVAGLQQAFTEDPPAIFLAWSVQARAVSKRFQVPPADAGRDMLSNVRLWKPVDDTRARQN
jgi:peptide/nickel transport system substrate-binding protein